MRIIRKVHIDILLYNRIKCDTKSVNKFEESLLVACLSVTMPNLAYVFKTVFYTPVPNILKTSKTWQNTP